MNFVPLINAREDLNEEEKKEMIFVFKTFQQICEILLDKDLNVTLNVLNLLNEFFLKNSFILNEVKNESHN